MSTKNQDIKAAIRRFTYFNNFTDEKVEECCGIARIEQFKPHQLIFSQSDIANFSYFVLSGQCMILQCLKIQIKENGNCRLVTSKKKLDPLELAMMASLKEIGPASMINSGCKDIIHQFIDVATYSCGGVFGIGEEMENRVIIAKTDVQCLMIPRFWLFQKAQNIANIWYRLKIFNDFSVPSQKKLFENFQINRKWKIYKSKIIHQIKNEYNISDSLTQGYNVPIICRIESKDNCKTT